jgi:hypothetical protein
MNVLHIIGLVIIILGTGLLVGLAREFIKDRWESKAARARRRWVELNKDETDREIAALMRASEQPWLAKELRLK